MKLPILTYHSLDATDSPVSVRPASFRHHVETLRQAGYRGVSLREALALADSSDADGKIVALTFDDGYASAAELAAPILAAYGWTATIFPVAGFVGRTNRWPTQPPSIPEAPLVDWADLRRLSEAGWEIGGHALTHPDLTRAHELARELTDAAAMLEDRIGQAVTTFSYPYGQFDPRVQGAVRGRFAAACTTRMAIAEAPFDAFALPRLDMWYFNRGGAHRFLAPRYLEPYVVLCGWRRRASTMLRRLLSPRPAYSDAPIVSPRPDRHPEESRRRP